MPIGGSCCYPPSVAKLVCRRMAELEHSISETWCNLPHFAPFSFQFRLPQLSLFIRLIYCCCLSNTPPRWINSSGGPFSAESQHPAHKKSNGGSHLSTRHKKSRFNLICAFLNGWNMKFRKFQFLKMTGSHVSKTRKKKCLKKSRFVCPNSYFYPSTKSFHKYGNMDLEKLITTNPV